MPTLAVRIGASPTPWGQVAWSMIYHDPYVHIYRSNVPMYSCIYYLCIYPFYPMKSPWSPWNHYHHHHDVCKFKFHIFDQFLFTFPSYPSNMSGFIPPLYPLCEPCLNPYNVGSTTKNHPPVITILKGMVTIPKWYKPFPVMCGLWQGFTHINPSINHYQPLLTIINHY